MIATAALRSAALIAGRQRIAASIVSGSSSLQQRWINLPKKFTDVLGEPDNLIPTEKDHKSKHDEIPGASPALKKDMEELGIESVDDLDELEEKNLEFFNESGLVPPDDAGTFAKPILIPSRENDRVVGYIDPVTHATFWFTIENDECTYFIKDLGLFFKMWHIEDEEAAGAH